MHTAFFFWGGGSCTTLVALLKLTPLHTDTHATQVEGLPATALGLAAQQAKGAGHEGATAEEGPWLFTLDFPSY